MLVFFNQFFFLCKTKLTKKNTNKINHKGKGIHNKKDKLRYEYNIRFSQIHYTFDEYNK